MKQKRHTIRATDEKWDLIEAYAEQRGRSISNFLIETAMSEITRHAAKKAFRELVKELVSEVLKDSFPSKGNPSESISKGDKERDFWPPVRLSSGKIAKSPKEL